MGACRHCRACAQLARALAVRAGRPACRLARRDGVCPRAGAGRLGHPNTAGKVADQTSIGRPAWAVHVGQHAFALGTAMGLIGALAFLAGGDGGRRSPEHPLNRCDDVLSAGERHRPFTVLVYGILGPTAEML